MAEIQKPMPSMDGDSRYFWEKCREERLEIQQCQDCRQFYFYPRLVCPHCMSDNVEWKPVSGRGKVYAFTIARRPAGPAFADDVPYAIGLIDLDEGVRMMSNIVNVPADEIRCDMPVQVVFEKVSDEFVLPKFEPIKE